MAGHDLLFLVLIVVSLGTTVRVDSQLCTDHYQSTCPDALSIVQQEVAAAIQNETRMGASLLRLHFHDCFVNVSNTT